MPTLPRTVAMPDARITLLTVGLAVSAACGSSEPGVTNPPPDQHPITRSGRIVFQANCAAGGSDIYSMAVDGTDRRALAATTEPEREPIWSADGSKIAFISGGPGGYWVSVMNADGTGRRDITSPSADGNPAWSPDGSQIVFESRRSGEPRIAIVNADGSGLRELSGFGVDPAWSPDGKTIVYTAPGPTGTRIVAIESSGFNLRPVTTPPFAASDFHATWSPDSRQIAFARTVSDGSATIRIVDADGQHERQLTQFGTESTPAWSPDGQYIVFAHSTDGSSAALRLHVVGVDGSGFHVLPGGTCPEGYPSW